MHSLNMCLTTVNGHLQSGQFWFQIQIPAAQVALRCFDVSDDIIYLCTAQSRI